MNASLRLIEGSFPEVGNVPNTEGALSRLQLALDGLALIQSLSVCAHSSPGKNAGSTGQNVLGLTWRPPSRA